MDELYSKIVHIFNNTPKELVVDEFNERNKYNAENPGNGRQVDKKTFDIYFLKDCEIFTCNYILVASGARTAYYMDLFYSFKFIEHLRKNLEKKLASLPLHEKRFRVFYRHECREQILTVFNSSSSFEMFMGTILDYPHIIDTFKGEERLIVSIETNNAYLYSFKSKEPIDMTTTVEKYNKILEPLGFPVHSTTIRI